MNTTPWQGRIDTGSQRPTWSPSVATSHVTTALAAVGRWLPSTSAAAMHFMQLQGEAMLWHKRVGGDRHADVTSVLPKWAETTHGIAITYRPQPEDGASANVDIARQYTKQMANALAQSQPIAPHPQVQGVALTLAQTGLYRDLAPNINALAHGIDHGVLMLPWPVPVTVTSELPGQSSDEHTLNLRAISWHPVPGELVRITEWLESSDGTISSGIDALDSHIDEHIAQTGSTLPPLVPGDGYTIALGASDPDNAVDNARARITQSAATRGPEETPWTPGTALDDEHIPAALRILGVFSDIQCAGLAKTVPGPEGRVQILTQPD